MKTHCPHGHVLDGVRDYGVRYCKTCANISAQTKKEIGVPRAPQLTPALRQTSLDKASWQDIEKYFIIRRLKICSGDVKQVSDSLGLSTSIIYIRLRTWGINPKELRYQFHEPFDTELSNALPLGTM